MIRRTLVIGSACLVAACGEEGGLDATTAIDASDSGVLAVLDASDSGAGFPDIGGDGGGDAGDAGPEYTVACGTGWTWPETLPDPTVAVVGITSSRTNELNTRIRIDGPERFVTEGPFCWLTTSPGRYQFSLEIEGAVTATLAIDLEVNATTNIALYVHPTHGSGLRAVVDRQAAPPLGKWRLEMLNVVTDLFGSDIDVYAYPKGWPAPPTTSTLSPTLVMTVPWGEAVSALVDANPAYFAFVESGTPTSTAAMVRSVPCSSEMISIAQLIWCDTAFPWDDVGGPCFGLMGASEIGNASYGDSCFE